MGLGTWRRSGLALAVVVATGLLTATSSASSIRHPSLQSGWRSPYIGVAEKGAVSNNSCPGFVNGTYEGTFSGTGTGTLAGQSWSGQLLVTLGFDATSMTWQMDALWNPSQDISTAHATVFGPAGAPVVGSPASAIEAGTTGEGSVSCPGFSVDLASTAGDADIEATQQPGGSFSGSWSETGATGSWSLHFLSAGLPFNPLGLVRCATRSLCVATGTAGAQLGVGSTIVTADGGDTWTQGVIADDQMLAAYCLPGSSDCWSADIGSLGNANFILQATPAIFRSTDGGVTWASATLPDGSTSTFVYSIWCIDASDCFAAGDNSSTNDSEIWASTDGGATWRVADEYSGGGFPSIACPDRSSCVVAGGATLQVTTDGGVTWVSRPMPPYFSGDGLACPTPTECFAGGFESGGNESQAAVLFQTSNLGLTWRMALVVPPPTTNGVPEANNVFSDMSCLTTSTCIVVGATLPNSSTSTSQQELSYITTDGGGAWTPMTVPSQSAPYVFEGISCPTATHCLGIGSTQTSSLLGSGALVALSISAGGVASSTLEGMTVAGAGGADGADSVIQAQYPESPVGDLASASDYFDAALSQGNSFSSLRVEVCNRNVTPTSTISWWDPTADGGSGTWSPIVGDPGPTYDGSGAVPCLITTLDGASYPNLSQLTGTVVGLGQAKMGSIVLRSSHLAIGIGKRVKYTATAVEPKGIRLRDHVTFTSGGRTVCRDVPLQSNVATCHAVYRSSGPRDIVASLHGSKFSANLTEYVGKMPAVTLQPKSKSVTVDGTVTLTASATGSPSATVQWAVSTNGRTFQPIVGARSRSYTFEWTTNAPQYFRAVFRNVFGRVITKVAKLTSIRS